VAHTRPHQYFLHPNYLLEKSVATGNTLKHSYPMRPVPQEYPTNSYCSFVNINVVYLFLNTLLLGAELENKIHHFYPHQLL
jgi:hypothetical protein